MVDLALRQQNIEEQDESEAARCLGSTSSVSGPTALMGVPMAMSDHICRAGASAYLLLTGCKVGGGSQVLTLCRQRETTWVEILQAFSVRLAARLNVSSLQLSYSQFVLLIKDICSKELRITDSHPA
jgi:hypothetical protein